MDEDQVTTIVQAELEKFREELSQELSDLEERINALENDRALQSDIDDIRGDIQQLDGRIDDIC